MTCLASTTSFRAIHHPLSAKEKAFFSVTPSLLMIREEEEEEREVLGSMNWFNRVRGLRQVKQR
jgi:hypothetical protein